jgi:L-ascorbate metabolism protein UlaG (beta-lactamase superfamily)
MTIKSITYAGHSAVFFESEKSVVAIDPWLNDNPRCPDRLKNPAKLDLIILSHGHSDHAGDVLRLAKACGSTIAATYELACILVNQGVKPDKVLFMNKGGTASFGEFKISLTNAFHSSSYDTPSGPVYAGEPCGVVLNDGKRSFYHSGDTALFSDMELIGELYKPEIGFFASGDNFTMNPREAAMAANYVGCRIAFPIHFKTFPMLVQSADAFIAACRSYDIDAAELEPGKPFQV